MLQAAITETVKVITNINDVVVTLKDGYGTTTFYVYEGMMSNYDCYVTLRESQSLVALKLLRNSTLGNYYYSISYFSRIMSKKLNAPLYADISSWQLLEITQPPTSSRTSSEPSSMSKVISLVSAYLHSSWALCCILPCIIWLSHLSHEKLTFSNWSLT